jgi:hypothetical protein
MADLSFTEKQILENILEMRSGFVLDFTNRSFQEIVSDATGLDIYLEKYEDGGTSKANLLRSFWAKESNQAISKLLFALAHYWENIMIVPMGGHVNLDNKYFKGLLQIAERLKNEMSEHIEAIDTDISDVTFQKLKKIIAELIENNKPDEAIDRLHTYMVMYLRKLLTRHGITFNENMALHSLLGSYKNKLMQARIIESGMTEEILKSAIVILEKYNHVRNNQSLAHANQLLNYNESLLIFKVVSSMVEFIESIEHTNKFN